LIVSRPSRGLAGSGVRGAALTVEDGDLAEQIAERLQREIQRLVFTSPDGQRFGVTISLGVTYLKASDPDLSALFARADAAMYTAKRLGKNQVIVA